MNTVYIKRKQYINFRMRKLIAAFVLENAEVLLVMDARERAQFIAEGIETIVCEHYFIKDKRRIQMLNQSKAA